MPRRPALFLLLCASACHSSSASYPSSGSASGALILRVDAVQVAPTRAGTASSWDIPAPQPSDGAECGLLSLAGSIFFNPIAGKGAGYLCNLASRPAQQEQDPSAPDLVVALGAGVATNYQTYTARNTFFHVFRQEFVVPTDAIPPEGLLLSVLDRDGAQSEVVGAIRLNRDQLVTAAYSNPVLTLNDAQSGLLRLELIVSPYQGQTEPIRVPMNASSGTTSPPMRPVRAGEVVEVSATGSYKVGSWFSKTIDPRGYPGREAQSYNFETEPFRSAPHGSGIVMVGNADAKTGEVVAPCARFVARGAGPLVVGLNDSDPKNNEGSAEFVVSINPPSASEWLGAQTAGCGAR